MTSARARFTLVFLLFCGCSVRPASETAKAPAAPRGVERITYQSWPGALRLFNGTAEAVIVPSIGRVMRYGYVGGENLLWEDPKLFGQRGAGVDQKTWRNFGGEKVWPWPQSDWPRYGGREWPPPIEVDQRPHEATVVDRSTVRLVSPVLPGYGVRVARTFRLAPTGSRLTMTIEFIPTRDQRPPAVPWTVAQLRVPDLMMARLAPGAGTAYKPMDKFDWPGVKRIDTRALQLERTPGRAEKIGIDADLLIWVKGSTFFVQRSLSAVSSDFAPAERAQIFSQKGKDSYVEYEFVAPRGERSMTVTWELQDLPRDSAKPAAIAGYLRNL